MISAFYYQVYFRNDPHICLVLVRLDEPSNPMERAREKVIEQFRTKDFRIVEASLKNILEQIIFVEDIALLTVLNFKIN